MVIRLSNIAGMGKQNEFYVEVQCNVQAPPEDEDGEWTRCHSLWFTFHNKFIFQSFGKKKKREIEWDPGALFF